MSETISYTAQSYKRTIDYNSNFVLIGNNIDGSVDVDLIRFNNFEEVKLKLKSILVNLECFGEWDLKLYQVQKNFKISKKYGYYKVPRSGKLILRHSYMDYQIKSLDFFNHKLEIVGSHMEIIENWNAKSNEDFLNYKIDIEVITIHFNEHAKTA
ncbi:hypothetical protein [Flavobacterium tegetincola]|uniref:hypothetical protein n=1 Tax=Flavobacterium tegetincola TaxID=150172 RepID=UPI000557FDF8|nr:hypothetical protein [Flavobacterium tegetincola]